MPDQPAKGPRKGSQSELSTRAFRQRGIDVEIKESKDRVELTLDGHPVDVTVDGGEFHSQLANQFMAFPTIDDLVESLLANEGRTWTLHGHLCDERCTGGRHAHGPGQGGDHDHGGHDHGHHG